MTLCNDDKKLAREGTFSEQMALWFLAGLLNDRWRTNSKSVDVKAEWKLRRWKEGDGCELKTHLGTSLGRFLQREENENPPENEAKRAWWCIFYSNRIWRYFQQLQRSLTTEHIQYSTVVQGEKNYVHKRSAMLLSPPPQWTQRFNATSSVCSLLQVTLGIWRGNSRKDNCSTK